MACACSNSIRVIGQHSVCLDFFKDSLKRRRAMEARFLLNPFRALMEITANNKEMTITHAHEEEEDLLGSQTYFSIRDSKVETIHSAPEEEQQQLGLIYLCFFLAGIGLSMCWGSISFLVTFWTSSYYGKIWPIFLIAYNVPGFFVLILQLATDRWCQVLFCNNSPHRAYMWRGFCALLTLAILCFSVPFLQDLHSSVAITLLVLFVGITVGFAHGWLFSLGSAFPPKCTGYLLGGTGMATLILLILTLALIPNQEPTREHFYIYFFSSGTVTLLACIAYLFMFSRPISNQFLSPAESLFEPDEPQLSSDNILSLKRVSIWSTMKQIWIETFTVFQTTFTVVALSTLVTQVPASHFSPITYPVILLYATSVAYYLGNEMGVWIPLSRPFLLAFGTIRLFFILPLIFYMAQTKWLNDFVFLGVVSVYAATGSWFTSKAYQLSATNVSKGHSGRVSNIINLFLYCGVFVGLATPFWLKKTYFSFL